MLKNSSIVDLINMLKINFIITNRPAAIKVHLLVLYLLCSTSVYSQTGLPNINSVPKIELLPPTPQAASLGKYGQVPVSYQTGVPNISIPIYEIKLNDFSFPISLSYHAGGVKVDDVASNIGIGWSLMAGGSISTTVKSNQNLDAPDSTWSPPNSTGFDPCVYLENAPAEYSTTKLWVENPLVYNFEPQIYNFNFGNYSGRFIIQAGTPDISSIGTLVVNQQAMLIPQKSLKIYYVTDPADQVSFYVAIDETGVKYFFKQMEYTSMNTVCTPGSMNVQYPTDNESFVLSSIQTPNGHTLTFTHRTESYAYQLSKTQTATKIIDGDFGCVATPTASECINTMTVTTKLVESITSSDGQRINFRYKDDREDLPNSKSLDSIKIFYDINQNSVLPDKEFYLVNSQSAGRLRLDAVKNINGVKQLPPYTFQYSQLSLPPRLSNDQDYFGYYNGAANGVKFIPLQAGIPPFSVIYYGANRDVSSFYSEAGALTKITYPTGGATEFTFATNVNGGLRVATIKDLTETGSVANERQFNYGGGASSISLSYLTSYSIIQVLEDNNTLMCPIGPCSYNQFSSYPQTSDLVTINTGYGSVEEIIGNSTLGYAGKTKYEYMHNSDFILEPGFHHVTNGFYLTDWSFINNLVKRVTQYKYEASVWSPVKSTEYKYELPRVKQLGFKASKIEQTESEQRIDLTIFCFECVTAKFLIRRYQFVTAWPRVIEEVETEYDFLGNPTLTRNTFFKDFDTYSFNSRQVEYVTSEGKKQIAYRKYPSSYLGYSAYQDMIGRNIQPLIEEIITENNTNKILAGSINDYQLNNNKFKLINYLAYETSAINNYSGGAPYVTNPQTPPGTFANKLAIESYDANGNPTQFRKSDGKRISYLWSSNGRYLQAAVENGYLSQSYYNGFETTGTTATTEPAKTGVKYFNGDFSMNLSGIATGSTLSYWYWNVDKWIFKKVVYNGGATTLTDGTRIDEVRVTPPGAFMQTFTHIPGVGISSVTDLNGNTTYFNYDGFGRLINSKDFDLNTLSINQYHYLNEN